MEVRFESMVCLWDDKIPTMFLEFVNLLTLTTSEEQLRRGVKEFAEKQELEFSDAPSMDESTEPEDLQQTTDNTGSTGDEWELEEKEQEDDSEQGDIHV